jgi:hypothetical protein
MMSQTERSNQLPNDALHLTAIPLALYGDCVAMNRALTRHREPLQTDHRCIAAKMYEFGCRAHPCPVD